jgi:LysM repeat protein
MNANVDYENNYDNPEPEVDDADDTETEGQAPKKRNPLRLILLVLVILILLCVVCWLGSSLLGGAILDPIRGLLPGGDSGVTVVPVDTPVPPVTEEPGGEPVEPAPTDEGMLPTEEPSTPLDTPAATTEPPQEPGAPTEEPVIAPTGEATTEPVPGPTNTPTSESGGPIVITPINCEGNVAPVAVANGPYDGMMGKGQAFVTFDATGSVDSDGTIVEFEWDFGDQSAPGYGPMVTHGYTNPGNYVAILTVTDNCNASGQDTAEVLISGPTPPGETVTPDPNQTPTTEPTTSPPNNITLGFCYIVHYGDTLSGIAWYYGVPLQDLAYVNNVPPDYFVKAGEGLFIPYGPIVEGANGYQVQYGDTIQSVAYQCAVSPSAVAEANGIPVDTALTPGEVIIIPIGRY